MSIQLSEAAPADRYTWVRRGLVLLGLAVGVVLAGVLLSGPAHADTGSDHDLLSGSTTQAESPDQPADVLHAVTQRARGTADKVSQRAEAVVQTTTRAVGQAARPQARPAPSSPIPSEATTPERSRSVTPVARDAQEPRTDRREPRTTHAPRRSSATHAARATRIDVPSTVRDTTTHTTRALVSLTDRTTDALRRVTDAVAPALSPVVRGVGTTVDGIARHVDTTVNLSTRGLDTGISRLEGDVLPAGNVLDPAGSTVVRPTRTPAHDVTRAATTSQHGTVRPAEPTSVPAPSVAGTPGDHDSASMLDPAPLQRPGQPSLGDPIAACSSTSGGSSASHGGGAAPAALLDGAAVTDARTVTLPRGYDRTLLSGPSFDPGSSPD